MAKKSKAAHGIKSQFVRSKPAATAQEVVDLAKKQGIKLTASHVYNIRANDKRRGQSTSSTDQSPPSPPAKRGRKAGNGLATQSSGVAPLDAQFRTLVLRMGLDRAEQLFSELKATLTMSLSTPTRSARASVKTTGTPSISTGDASGEAAAQAN